MIKQIQLSLRHLLAYIYTFAIKVGWKQSSFTKKIISVVFKFYVATFHQRLLSNYVSPSRYDFPRLITFHAYLLSHEEAIKLRISCDEVKIIFVKFTVAIMSQLTVMEYLVLTFRPKCSNCLHNNPVCDCDLPNLTSHLRSPQYFGGTHVAQTSIFYGFVLCLSLSFQLWRCQFFV